MHSSPSGPVSQFRNRVVPILTGPPILAFLPATCLAAYWLLGEGALLAVSLGLPLLFAFAGAFSRNTATAAVPRDSVTGLVLREGFDSVMQSVFRTTNGTGLTSACFVLELDEFQEFVVRQGQAAADSVVQRAGERIVSMLRADDTVSRIGDCRFAICLKPVRHLDLELCIQLAGRMQSAVEEPISVDGATVYMSCSVGFCPRSNVSSDTPADWLDAGIAALAEAQSTGPSGIRAYSTNTRRKFQSDKDLRDQVAGALEGGQIQPWYQPQISTDTGKVTGFEALARWAHPIRGVITPDQFLLVMEECGLMERLGEVMLYHSLTALKAWDSAGAKVPRVGVNFSTEELRNPRLVERIQWELDRFDLTADRLSVEILETVVADTPDDTVTRNIAGLSALGCRIDLDDFGTGQASIASIRRFSVSRIKVDRSFIAKADRDPDQQRMISAILTLAERLELETLAEGVETVGEHALLAQLGCDHVQGFGIARPMPFEQTLDWIASHEAKLQDAPRIGRETG